VELKGDDLWSYSHEIDSSSLRKMSIRSSAYINKKYLSAITVTGIFQSFFQFFSFSDLQAGGENKLA